MNPNEPQLPQQPSSPQPTQPVDVSNMVAPQSTPQATTQPQPQPNTFGEQHKVAAFMNPSAPSTPPPPRSHKKLILTVLILAALTGIAIVVFALMRGPQKPSETNASQANNQEQQPVDEQRTTIGKPLSNDIAVSAPPSFVIPTLPSWEKSERNTDLNRIDHVGGCSVTFTQSKNRSNEELGDAEATNLSINNLLDDLRASGTVSEVTDGIAQLAISDSDETVEFKTTTLKYSSGLAEFRQIATVRNIDGYIMGARFFCPTPAFSENLNAQVFEELTITLREQE